MTWAHDGILIPQTVMDYTSSSAVSLLGVSPLLSVQFLLLNFQEHHPLHPLIVSTLIAQRMHGTGVCVCVCVCRVCVCVQWGGGYTMMFTQ